MAVESQTSVAEAAPLNGYLQDDVDCDELIATVYGIHLHIDINFVVCFYVLVAIKIKRYNTG